MPNTKIESFNCIHTIQTIHNIPTDYSLILGHTTQICRYNYAPTNVTGYHIESKHSTLQWTIRAAVMRCEKDSRMRCFAFFVCTKFFTVIENSFVLTLDCFRGHCGWVT